MYSPVVGAEIWTGHPTIPAAWVAKAVKALALCVLYMLYNVILH